MTISTNTVKLAGRPDLTKRRVLISNGIMPGGFDFDPNRYRRVKKVTPNAVPNGGFRMIQAADLRDIETRKRNAIVVAQKKAAVKAIAAAAVSKGESPAPAKRKAGRPRKAKAE